MTISEYRKILPTNAVGSAFVTWGDGQVHDLETEIIWFESKSDISFLDIVDYEEISDDFADVLSSKSTEQRKADYANDMLSRIAESHYCIKRASREQYFDRTSLEVMDVDDIILNKRYKLASSNETVIARLSYEMLRQNVQITREALDLLHKAGLINCEDIKKLVRRKRKIDLELLKDGLLSDEHSPLVGFGIEPESAFKIEKLTPYKSSEVSIDEDKLKSYFKQSFVRGVNGYCYFDNLLKHIAECTKKQDIANIALAAYRGDKLHEDIKNKYKNSFKGWYKELCVTTGLECGTFRENKLKSDEELKSIYYYLFT